MVDTSALFSIIFVSNTTLTGYDDSDLRTLNYTFLGNKEMITYHAPYLSSDPSPLGKPNGPEHSPTLKRETTLSLNSGQRGRQPSHNKEDAEHSRHGLLKK